MYKLLQITSVLIERYGFSQVMIEEFKEHVRKEAWLANFDDPHYQLIRVTFNPASMFSYDEERVKIYLDYFEKTFKFKVSFLDIHLGNDEYDPELEPFDYANIEDGKISGVDLGAVYPEILTSSKKTEDPVKEIDLHLRKIQNAINKRRESRTSRSKLPVLTLVLVGICVIVYLLSVYLGRKYSLSSAYVLLGGNYTTFTVGLREYWRLLTCAFVHGGYLHLLTNMYSLLMLGQYMEERFGKLRFLLALAVCTIAGSLCQLILGANTVTVGMSGGLYGLMVIFVLDLINNHHAPVRTFMPLIFINLSINFLSTTAWQAHLGGAVCGYLFYKIFDGDGRKDMIALLAVLLICLFYKTFSIDTISPLYGGTDMEIARMYEDIGLKDHAIRLAERLLMVYQRYGG